LLDEATDCCRMTVNSVNILQFNCSSSQQEENKALSATKKRKVKWTGHILRRNCLSHTILMKRERTGRRGRRCKKLLNDRKQRRRWWKFKEEALCLTLSRIRLRSPVVRGNYAAADGYDDDDDDDDDSNKEDSSTS